jgi:hypothetical protein
MINRDYDRNFPYKYVDYSRMSVKRQDERSPDQQDSAQQYRSIEEAIRRLGLPWQDIKIYRDVTRR